MRLSLVKQGVSITIVRHFFSEYKIIFCIIIIAPFFRIWKSSNALRKEICIHFLKPSTVITPPNLVGSPSSCQAGLVLCCRPGGYQCGIRYPPVAGSPTPGAGQAPYGAYPWQAALLGPGDVYIASGVLINPTNVLTVAHRVTQFMWVLL